MNYIDIKIFGQTFQINPPDSKRQFYIDIANKVNEMMTEEGKKADIRSDVRVAVKVAFILAAENMELKGEINKSLEVLERIDNNINALDA